MQVSSGAAVNLGSTTRVPGLSARGTSWLVLWFACREPHSQPCGLPVHSPLLHHPLTSQPLLNCAATVTQCCAHYPMLPPFLYLQVDFPERPGALRDFLAGLDTRWNITLFHYRRTGVTLVFEVGDYFANSALQRLFHMSLCAAADGAARCPSHLAAGPCRQQCERCAAGHPGAARRR